MVSGGSPNVGNWHPSDALIKTERVGSLVLSGRAYKGRELTRLILGRDRAACRDQLGGTEADFRVIPYGLLQAWVRQSPSAKPMRFE